MRLFSLIILAGLIYFSSLFSCWADDIPINYLNPDDVHARVVNQALDKIESSRTIQKSFFPSAIIPKKNEFEFSSETYWAKFDEPKNYSQKGVLSGYNAQYAHRFSSNPKSIINMYGLQAQWADGKFKQASYVGPAGIKDRTFDFRGIVGKDFYPAPNVRTTGYLGIGYRYLEDNAEGLNYTFYDPTFSQTVTTLGYKGYSHYDYLPFGVDIVWQTNPAYGWESNLEYDYVFNGWQVDKLGVYSFGGLNFNTLILNQRNGDGLRASLRLNLYFKYLTAFAEGFYRYWNLPQTKGKDDLSTDISEPKNNTQEFGFRLGIQV